MLDLWATNGSRYELDETVEDFWNDLRSGIKAFKVKIPGINSDLYLMTNHIVAFREVEDETL